MRRSTIRLSSRWAGVLAALLAGPAMVSAQATVASTGQRLSETAGIAYHAVIAHRGDSFHAPEETRPAYQLARDEGADYLELDLQRTSDGQLIALHDNNLKRTTNIKQVFPDRADDPVSTFTLAEIKQLDAGSWFNDTYPDRARESFVGLKILTLDEVRQIAEGGTNHPGLYLETKVPDLFPGIESDLRDYLLAQNWIGSTPLMAPTGFEASKRVDVAFTPGRVVLQTFSRQSLQNLQAVMPDTPKVLLLFLGKGGDNIPAMGIAKKCPNESEAQFTARQRADPTAYLEALDFARHNGAIGVGPSATRVDRDATFSYTDLATPWQIAAALVVGWWCISIRPTMPSILHVTNCAA